MRSSCGIMNFFIASGNDSAWKFKPHDPEFWNAWGPHLGMLAALLAFTAIAAGSFYSINGLQKQARLVDHAHRVMARLDNVYADLKDAQSDARIFVSAGTPKLLKEFEFYTSGVSHELAELRILVSDNPRQLQNLSGLNTLIDKHLSYLKEGIALRQANHDAAAFFYLSGDEGMRLIEDVRAEISIMRNEESTLLAERSRAVAEHTRNTKLLIIFGSVGAYLMVGGAYLILRQETLRRMRADRALHNANESLHRHAAQLEATNKELESFSYSISHDLRIPLRAVAGYARMLEEDYSDRLDDEGRRLLKVISDNGKRMGNLINDLLTFSRLGRKEIVATEVDMTALAQTVANELAGTEANPATQLTIDTMPPAWGDRSLLQQVWSNLVSNAFKYSSTRATPEVTVGADEQADETVYRVSDNGVGFDMQYYDKLFGVFQRLHSNEEFPGTGVGLAIVQRIVVRHGGRVWAHGEVGKGATFYFSLPRRIDHAESGRA
jgi:signal transduction histidine kinase